MGGFFMQYDDFMQCDEGVKVVDITATGQATKTGHYQVTVSNGTKSETSLVNEPNMHVALHTAIQGFLASLGTKNADGAIVPAVAQSISTRILPGIAA